MWSCRDLAPIHPPRDVTPIHPPRDVTPIHSPRDVTPIHPPRDVTPIHPPRDVTPIHPVMSPHPPRDVTPPAPFSLQTLPALCTNQAEMDFLMEALIMRSVLLMVSATFIRLNIRSICFHLFKARSTSAT